MRFPGFEGEWVAKKFGEVATNKSGKYNPTSARSSIKCIELEHLVSESGQLIGYIDGSRSGSIKNIFSKGDVLFGKLRPYLRKYLQAPFDGACSSEIWVLKGKGVLNDFLYQIVQTDKFIDLANQSSGSKMPRADWSVVEKGTFSFPTITEQQKISRFLSLLDSRIATQNKIIERLETLIKGLNEQLFNQKLRFKDDNGNDFSDWEIKSLGQVFSYKITNSYSREKLNYEEGNVKNIHYGDIHTQYRTLFNAQKENAPYINPDVNINKIEEENYCKKGDVIIADASEDLKDVGKSIELVSLNGQKILAGLHTILARPMGDIFSIGFCGYLFKSQKIRQQIQNEAQGSKVLSISASRLSKVVLCIPCLGEQTKIVDFLFGIDEKIETEKRVLKRYEFQKKYFLHELFI